MSLFPVLIGFDRIPSGSIRSGFLVPVSRFPSRGNDFPTNSPFTSAWDDLPFRSASGTHRASPLTTPWSACPNRYTPCGSLSEQSLYLLPSPGASGISFGCAGFWRGRPRSSQGGWHFDCRSDAGIPSCWESSSTCVNMCLWRKGQCVKKCVSTLYCNPCS